MRITLIIDEDLLAKAAKATGIKEKSALINAGLEALIEKKGARTLAAFGGSDPKAQAGRRRRPGDWS